MITLISMPYKLWHKNFIEQYGVRFAAAIEKRLTASEDDKIRDLEHSTSYQAIQAAGMIKQRLMTRQEAKQEQDVLKLKFIKKCLESQFLEKRIQGIKDLNDNIKETTLQCDSKAS